MSESSTTTPAALRVVPSVANLSASWINLALDAERLDDELSACGAETLFDRLCDQVGRPIDSELPEADAADVYNIKRKGWKSKINSHLYFCYFQQFSWPSEFGLVKSGVLSG